MPNTYTAKSSITINAPLSHVWDALVNPKIIKQYLFGTNAISDWKVGSTIKYTGEWEGKTYEDKGTILEIEPLKLLKATYWSSFSGLPDTPENYNVVSYELYESNGQTTLTVTQDNIPTTEKRDDSEKNWGMVLANLKKLMEK